MASGNDNVILCERGIRTFDDYTRNTLDLAAVQMLHELSHLPVIVDRAESVCKMAKVSEQTIRLIVSAPDDTLRVKIKED